MDKDDPGVSWLLQSKDPSVRYFTLTDVLGEPEQSSKVVAAKRQIPRGLRPRVLSFYRNEQTKELVFTGTGSGREALAPRLGSRAKFVGLCDNRLVGFEGGFPAGEKFQFRHRGKERGGEVLRQARAAGNSLDQYWDKWEQLR